MRFIDEDLKRLQIIERGLNYTNTNERLKIYRTELYNMLIRHNYEKIISDKVYPLLEKIRIMRRDNKRNLK